VSHIECPHDDINPLIRFDMQIEQMLGSSAIPHEINVMISGVGMSHSGQCAGFSDNLSQHA
jgi:hypothetical protein